MRIALFGRGATVGKLAQRGYCRVSLASISMLLLVFITFVGSLHADDEVRNSSLKWGLTVLAGTEAGNKSNQLALGSGLVAQWNKSERIGFEAFSLWQPIGYMDGTDGQRLGVGLGVMERPARLRFMGNRAFVEEHGTLYYQEQYLPRADVAGMAWALGVQTGIEIPVVVTKCCPC
jgi:hypothetical protein